MFSLVGRDFNTFKGRTSQKSIHICLLQHLLITILIREERLGQLVGVDPGDLVAAVEQLVAKAAHLRTEVFLHHLNLNLCFYLPLSHCLHLHRSSLCTVKEMFT